jgi:hypothetical protein
VNAPDGDATAPTAAGRAPDVGRGAALLLRGATALTFRTDAADADAIVPLVGVRPLRAVAEITLGANLDGSASGAASASENRSTRHSGEGESAVPSGPVNASRKTTSGRAGAPLAVIVAMVDSGTVRKVIP